MRVADGRFRYGSAGKLLSLAVGHNSLARFSKRKCGHRCFTQLACPHSLSPLGFRFFSDLVRGSFQLSLTLLLHYRSRDVIYGWKLMPPKFTRDFQRTLLEIPGISTSDIRLRACHPLRATSSTLFGLSGALCPGLITPHLPSLSGGIRFAVFRFRSPLFTESRLISFPPPTRMLHFGGSPLLTERSGFVAAGSPIR